MRPLCLKRRHAPKVSEEDGMCAAVGDMETCSLVPQGREDSGGGTYAPRSGVPSWTWTVVGPASIAGLPLPKREAQAGASEYRHGHTRDSCTTNAAL